MSKSIITMGFVGDMNGTIAGSLKDHIQLAPFSGSLQALSGVLWDSQSASGSSADRQAFQSVLESGKTLALAHPTAQQLASVREITGCGPSEPVALITYTRSKGGPSPYQCVMVPDGKVTSRVVASDTGAGPVLSSSAAAQLRSAIVRAVQSHTSSAAQIGSSSGLVAPTGSIYGYSSFQSSPLNWTVGAPYINNEQDDKTAQSNNQSPTGSTLTEFFVYYVNGQAPPDGNTPPYYIVILRQTGSFMCGLSQVAQTDNSRGWFQYEITVSPNNVRLNQMAPVAIRDSSNRLHLFCIDQTGAQTGALWTIGQGASNGGWGSWIPLATPTGVTLATLAVGSNQDGRLQVFSIDTANSLHTIYETAPGVWSAWNVLAPPTTSPSVTSVAVGQDPDGRLEVLAIATDGTMRHIAQTAPNNGWGAWASLGSWIDRLCVGQNADGRLQVFARGADKALWHVSQTAPNNGWSAWASLGGRVDELVVGRNADGRLEVFVIGSDHALCHIWQTAPNGNWSDWDTLEWPPGGALSTLTVGQDANGLLELFGLDSSGTLWHSWQTSPGSGRWSAWYSLGTPAGVQLRQIITTFQDQSGRLVVLGVTSDGALWQIQQVVPNAGWGNWFSTSPPPPFAGEVTLLGHAPTSFASQVPVVLQVPMTVIAQTQNGTGPVQFTATVNDLTLIPDWAVSDTSGGSSTSWNYHEVTAWDPTQNPPDEFHNWWKTMYPDKVVALPQLSCAPSNLNFEAVTAWRFDSSLITSPNSPTSRSLVVSFTGGWSQNLAFLHNPDGCLGAEAPKHDSPIERFTYRRHHLFCNSYSWPWTWTIDLGKVAVQT